MAVESSASGVVENGGVGGVVASVSGLGSGLLSDGVVGCGAGFVGGGQTIYGGLDSASFERVFSDPVCKGSDFYAAVRAYYTAVGLVRTGGVQSVHGLEHLHVVAGSDGGITYDSGSYGDHAGGFVRQYRLGQGASGGSGYSSSDNSSEVARGESLATGVVSVGGSSANLVGDHDLVVDEVDCSVKKSDVSDRTLLNRARREKAKFRKLRKKERQGAGVRSKDWNADKVRKSEGFVQNGSPRGYFSSCGEEVRNKLVETRARRLTVENELRVAEMEQKMRVMCLQKESRLIERQFENDRMKVEIEAKKRIGELPGGTVETVVSSGSISPNSSISLAAENRLRKDLADANEKIAKLTSGTTVCGSGANGVVLSPMERELRLANFELESIRLKDRAYGDYTFTDDDYKVSLQALRDEYADVLLTDDKRVARQAVSRVIEAFGSKVDDDMMEKVAELGYIDADTLVY